MAAIPWNLIFCGIALILAAAVATIGQAGRMPRYVAVPLTWAFLASASLAILVTNVVLDWAYHVYLETWPLSVLILADGAAVYFLLALWAGASSAHWFWRLGVMFGALALLTVVEMVEPMLMLMVGMLPVMAAGYGWKRWRKRSGPSDPRDSDGGATGRTHWRMRLRSAFLAFVIVGLVGVILRSAVHANLHVVWSGLAVEALIFACLGLATATLAAAPWKWRLMLMPLWCLASWLVIDWHNVNLSDWAGWSRVIGVGVRSVESGGLLILGWLTFSTIVGGTVWTAFATGCGARDSLRQRFGRIALAGVLLVATAPLARVYWGLIPPATDGDESALASRPAVDESSTFEQLIGKDWGIRWPWDARPTDRFEGKLLIAAELLKTPDRIWVDPTAYARMQFTDQVDEDLQTLLVLFYHFDRAAWMAAAEGRTADAKEYANAQWRIVKLLETSNLPEFTQAAQSHYPLAMSNYLTLHQQFSLEELKAVLGESAAFNGRRPSYAMLHAATAALQRHCENWRTRLSRVALELETSRATANRQVAPDFAEGRKWDYYIHVSHDALRVQLALELYRRQHGRWPERLDEMIPEILPELPVDPFVPHSTEPLVYRRTLDGYVLYSRGLDGSDDGGRYGSRFDDWCETGFDADLKIDSRKFEDAFSWRKLPVAVGTPGP
ncbi:MAG TPA: hypothetical protein VFB96_14135 [Pirellulaceae bacterium]|nr:hypothetical protein [Pirellulaceae bacterium]